VCKNVYHFKSCVFVPNVLQVGSSYGGMLNLLAKRTGGRAVGFKISPECVASYPVLNKYLAGSRLRRASARGGSAGAGRHRRGRLCGGSGGDRDVGKGVRQGCGA